LALPRDVGLDKDFYQKSRIFKETDSLVNYILNILLMRPGNMPSMPHIGINIGQYVQPTMQQQLDVELIKGLIVSNCEDLLPQLSTDELLVTVVMDEFNKPVLLIKIPIYVDEEEIKFDAYYAFYRNTLNELEFNFLVDDNL
jgi:hypothetical protein